MSKLSKFAQNLQKLKFSTVFLQLSKLGVFLRLLTVILTIVT